MSNRVLLETDGDFPSATRTRSLNKSDALSTIERV